MSATTHIVKVSSARTVGGYCGYVRIGLMEVEVTDGKPVYPRMISPRARGVVRLVEAWDSLYWGKGIRSEGRRVYDRATAEARRLNEVAS